MAQGQSLTLPALDKVMSEEHADVLREGVAAFVAKLMEAEVACRIGAELHEKAPNRVAQRNGYRSRGWDTRAGTFGLVGAASTAETSARPAPLQTPAVRP